MTAVSSSASDVQSSAVLTYLLKSYGGTCNYLIEHTVYIAPVPVSWSGTSARQSEGLTRRRHLTSRHGGPGEPPEAKNAPIALVYV